MKHHSAAKDHQDTVTISTELYERLLHATKMAEQPAAASVAESKRANAGPFGLFG